MAAARRPTLEESLAGDEPGLRTVLLAIARSAARISDILRGVSLELVGAANAFGDQQLQVPNPLLIHR